MLRNIPVTIEDTMPGFYLKKNLAKVDKRFINSKTTFYMLFIYFSSPTSILSVKVPKNEELFDVLFMDFKKTNAKLKAIWNKRMWLKLYLMV